MRKASRAYGGLPTVTEATVTSVVVLLVLALLYPSQVFAAWPSGTEGQVLVGFHEVYALEGDASSSHYGVDIPADAGVEIGAPVGAVVSFVGSVPSGAGDGSTTLGVSLVLEDGRTLTLLPFSSSCVSEGQVVGEGEVLGTLAAAGDRSSAGSHLHVGLKRGGTYFNPLEVLGTPGGYTAGQGGQDAWETQEEPTSVDLQTGQADEVMFSGDAATEPLTVGSAAASEVVASPGAVSSRLPDNQVAPAPVASTGKAVVEGGVEADGAAVSALCLLIAGTLAFMGVLVRRVGRSIARLNPGKWVLEEKEAVAEEGSGGNMMGGNRIPLPDGLLP